MVKALRVFCPLTQRRDPLNARTLRDNAKHFLRWLPFEGLEPVLAQHKGEVKVFVWLAATAKLFEAATSKDGALAWHATPTMLLPCGDLSRGPYSLLSMLQCPDRPDYTLYYILATSAAAGIEIHAGPKPEAWHRLLATLRSSSVGEMPSEGILALLAPHDGKPVGNVKARFSAAGLFHAC